MEEASVHYLTCLSAAQLGLLIDAVNFVNHLKPSENLTDEVVADPESQLVHNTSEKPSKSYSLMCQRQTYWISR